MEPICVVAGLTRWHHWLEGLRMQVAVALALLGGSSLVVGLWVRHLIQKRRKVRLRGTTNRGRIDIPLAPKD